MSISIKVRYFAVFREDKDKEYEFFNIHEPMTLLEFLNRYLGDIVNKIYLISIDGKIYPLKEARDILLKKNTEIRLYPPVGGG